MFFLFIFSSQCENEKTVLDEYKTKVSTKFLLEKLLCFFPRDKAQ